MRLLGQAKATADRLGLGFPDWASLETREGAGPAALRIGRFLNSVIYRTSVTGRERIPAEGGVIIAANHTGLLDGPMLYGGFPREGHILVKQEMFASPVVGAILHWSGQIALDRSGDRRAMAQATALLKKGKILGILPEGTRGTGSVEQINTGVAWLAVTAGVPVVPAAILGTRQTGQSRSALPRPGAKLVLDFGEPLTVSKRPGESGRETMKRAAEEIRVALAEHVRSAQDRTGLQLPTD